ncbi:MAG: TSUP family transporter [Clostridia bacterium]|nr:TSUP family transporter [Clostridia bacterium]
MSFILYLAAGFLSGFLGGMGMGGGTILIPTLTIFLGVGQHAAQATNLVAFLPMSAFSLKVHKDKGLLRTDGILWVIIPALVTSVLSGLLASVLPAEILRKMFGAFLILLAVKGILSLKFTVKEK